MYILKRIYGTLSIEFTYSLDDREQSSMEDTQHSTYKIQNTRRMQVLCSVENTEHFLISLHYYTYLRFTYSTLQNSVLYHTP